MKLEFREALLAVALLDCFEVMGQVAELEMAAPSQGDAALAERAAPISAASARVEEAAKLFASPEEAIARAKAFLESDVNAEEVRAALARFNRAVSPEETHG